MAEGPSTGAAWRGHTLRPLPAGESWLSGGERRELPRPRTDAQPLVEFDDEWWIDDDQHPRTVRQASTPAHAAPSGSRWTFALLVLVSLGAIATILIARRTGPPPEPAPLPAPPSHVINAVTRAQATTASIHVGEYLTFQLPNGRAYSTVLEQPSSQTPVAEALGMPGQQPQLRADSPGHAVIEVMSTPVCNQPDGCAYEHTFLGTVDLTVTP